MSARHSTPSVSASLLNEQETASLIGMSVHWLRRARWAGGGIPFIKVGEGPKGAVRYRGEDVEVFIASRLRRSTSDSGQPSGIGPNGNDTDAI